VVTVPDESLAVSDFENGVRADPGTHPATVAFCGIQLQGNYIGEINKSIHVTKL